MNPSVVTLQLPAAVTNGICLSQTPVAAGALTVNGSLVSGGVASLVTAQRVGVASSSGDSTVIFTITGTNASSAPIRSTVTGVSSNTVYTALDFLTVTSVTSSAATSGAITVGTVGVGSTDWVFDNFLAPFWALAVAVQLTGTVTYTVEHTYDDPNAALSPGTSAASNWSLEPLSAQPPTAWPNAALANKTTNGETTYSNQPIYAHRLTIISGTGKALMQSIAAGIGSP